MVVLFNAAKYARDPKTGFDGTEAPAPLWCTAQPVFHTVDVASFCIIPRTKVDERVRQEMEAHKRREQSLTQELHELR